MLHPACGYPRRYKERHGAADSGYRAATAYAGYHIPDSLNIPAYRIKSMAYLKPANLLLVNDGYSHAELETVCANLRKNGFAKVMILQGGLRAWGKHSGALEGTATPGELSLNEIQAHDLYAEQGRDDYLILDITRSGPRLEQVPAQIKRIGAVTDDTGFNKQVAVLISAEINLRRRPAAALTAVIINDSGRNDPKMAELIATTGVVDVVFLAGGWEAYKAFQISQIALLDRLANPVKRIPRCDS